MKKQLITIFSLFLCLPSLLFSQQDEILERAQIEWAKNNHLEDYPNYKASYDYEIYDDNLKMTFKVDSTEIYISAFDESGKLVWKRDPWKEEQLMLYRHNRPVIVEFRFDKLSTSLDNEKWKDRKEVIWIMYSNSQMGWIDKSSGEYFHFGQN